jgi:predicted component of type VI protein secretion system
VLTIGSGTGVGWRIVDHNLDPVHAMITMERDGRVLLTRGHPEAAIKVDGLALEWDRQWLEPGSRFQLGEADFQLVLVREAVSANEGFLRDTRRGRVFKLGLVNEIGRDLKCAVHLPEPDVSRSHAEVRAEGDKFVVRPRGAVTLLNGERLKAPAELREGDELGVGRTRLLFTRDAAVGGEAASTAAHEAVAKRGSRRAAMDTSYVGVVEVRDRQERISRRKMARAAALVVGAAALIAFGVGYATGRLPRPHVGVTTGATRQAPR